jgi:hypothetical protein
VGDQPTGPAVDADELSRLLANWGFGTSTTFANVVTEEPVDVDEQSLDAAFALLGEATEETLAPTPLTSGLAVSVSDDAELLLIREPSAAGAIDSIEIPSVGEETEAPSVSGRRGFQPGVRGLRG